MSNVQRYMALGPMMAPDELRVGGYVLAADYDALAAENQRLRDALIAKAQAAPEAEPVAEVSQETFSSDGTSDIITCNLPIGTKLYTAQQHDAELVELIEELIDVDDGGLDDYWREHAGKELMTRIDAKLASLRQGCS